MRLQCAFPSVACCWRRFDRSFIHIGSVFGYVIEACLMVSNGLNVGVLAGAIKPSCISGSLLGRPDDQSVEVRRPVLMELSGEPERRIGCGVEGLEGGVEGLESVVCVGPCDECFFGVEVIWHTKICIILLQILGTGDTQYI